ncbi:hypothetical protein RhiirC2_784586 [Rhizophagus irregularis]|uniref:Uncharacterized protein n=1 Tax=Rhizophagus irregularis TaxID=588596 RepID=A0A2N1MY65_9GLOM|nr:hypothetical protein RhiirC2_784586 [Rhizophagus irregularis]
MIKTRLNKYAIHNGKIPSNTLFNCPKFIQHLNTRNVYNSIEKWASTTEGKHSIYSPLQISNFTKLIFRSLFLIFIENEVNLHSFKVMVDYEEFKCFDAAFELILQNPNFVHNIKNLTLGFGEITDNVRKFLRFLCSNCKSISSFYFLFICNEYSIIEENLSQMIKFQENLKKISFRYKNPTLNLLLSLKNPNCSNTLNTIIFQYTNFENINVLSEVFNQLNVLESIHIIYCCSLDSKFIQQIKNITKPFKLKSLFLDQMDELLLEPSIILQNLGQILPFKLEYLNLGFAINESDLEVFLKNSQNTFIKKLLIRKNVRNPKNDGSQYILPYIKEYIMKKKRVKYLAISELWLFHRKNADLYSLKDKVKEFQLYDIQVLNYNDLVIDVYDFINKTY